MKGIPLPVHKTCGCGRAFTASEWDALPFRGEQREDGTPLVLVLRDCPCGSTLALPTPESAQAVIVALVALSQAAQRGSAVYAFAEDDLVRTAGEEYGFDERTVLAAIAAGLLAGQLDAYEDPRKAFALGKVYRVTSR